MSGCFWCALTGYCPTNIKQMIYEKLGRRWNTKYKKFLAGQDASTIQDTVIESKPSEPTSRYYKRINVDELKNTKTSHELHTQAMDDFSKAIDNDSKEISDDDKLKNIMETANELDYTCENYEKQIIKLKEDLVNQDNRVRLYFTAHETMKRQLGQLKSTLDEIKTITSSVLFNKELEQIKSILAKHEDKK